MFRRILLLLCIAFVVVVYGYPCFVLPIGSYKASYTLLGTTSTVSYNFQFNGKVKVTTKSGNNDAQEKEYFYKMDKNDIVLSENETFGDSDDSKLELVSMYRIGDAKNNVGFYATIGVGILAVILVLMPSKKR